MKELISKPELFNYGKLGKIRGLVINKEPWFVAKDLCDILEIKNVTQALDCLDDDERSMLNIGRQGETNIINESGLYALIIRSRKPEAKKFRKWITAEVLPQIRKTGSYMATAEDMKSLNYQSYRLIGKETRHLLTDEIQKIEQAYKKYGHNYNYIYSNFTKLIQKKADVITIERENLSIEKIKELDFVENVVYHVILKSINNNPETYEDWQKIYYTVKDVLDTM